MKISSFFATFFLGTFVFLTACGSGDSLGEALTRDYDTFNGEFKSLGSVKVNANVTHLFEKDDGTILYAYSDRYDLDEQLNTRVEAYGVVTTYETLDKALFEVKRVGVASEENTEEEAVTMEAYKNPELGISFTYPSNWSVKSEDAVRSVLEADDLPEVEALSDEEAALTTEVDMASEPAEKDQVEFVKLAAGLTKTSDETQEERASEIRSYVSAHFSELSAVTGDLTYVGVDRVLGLRYKPETGDTFIFAPRGSDLFELHFHSLSGNDATQVAHNNEFTAMVASFRFIPVGESVEEDEVLEEDASDAVEETTETSDEVSASSTAQVTVSKWGSLSSNAFEFSMSIPAAWYYVGGSTGYVFALEEIEDVNATGVVKLSFNGTTEEGTVRSASQVALTKKVESRYYTLTGSPEYETVMKTMLDSIKTTKAD